MYITNQYFLFIIQINTKNNMDVKIRREQKMKNSLIQNREKIQKAIMAIFQDEVQTLSSDLQSILIDDMVTAFYNRLSVMKKIQDRN